MSIKWVWQIFHFHVNISKENVWIIGVFLIVHLILCLIVINYAIFESSNARIVPKDIYWCSLQWRSYPIKVIYNGSLRKRGTYFKRTHFFVFVFNFNVDRNNGTASFYTIYEPFISPILNNFDKITILLSLHAVCTRINAIADNHLQDKVNYGL